GNYTETCINAWHKFAGHRVVGQFDAVAAIPLRAGSPNGGVKPPLFASHQAKASGESSALAPCESEGTDKGVDRIGIVVVDGIDGARAESPRLAVEPEPLFEANVHV